jgi:hypothetical protein
MKIRFFKNSAKPCGKFKHIGHDKKKKKTKTKTKTKTIDSVVYIELLLWFEDLSS